MRDRQNAGVASGFQSVSARDFALAKLDGAELPGWRRGQIRRALAEPSDPHQWAVGEAMYVGAVKNLLALRHRVGFHAGRPVGAIDELVQKILVLAAQQLVHMPRVPAAVVVDQAVEQCRRFGRARAAGMVNAVLRNFGRQEYPKPPADDVERTLSFLPETYGRLVAAIGAKKARAVVEHANGEAPVTVRLGAGVKPQALRDAVGGAEDAKGVVEGGVGNKARPDADPTKAGGAGAVKVIPHAQPGMVAVEGATRAEFRRWAELGLGQVQDPTAAAVVKALDLKPGMKVLDRCAGVGTKTLQIREAVGESGAVYAVDPNDRRMAVLDELLTRRGIGNVQVRRGEWAAELDLADAVGGGFDRVLADVPCSNSGVMCRRAEVRYYQSAGTLRSLERLQLRILADTAPLVKPGGLLVYSTCSIWPSENEGVVKQFLSKAAGKDFNLVAERTVWPDGSGEPARYRDGGFVAVLVKLE